MSDKVDPGTARHLWWAGEPYHSTVYFSPDAKAAYEAIGLKGFWMGYFASRAAAMGAVAPEVVQATFYNFHPDLVRRAIPDAWELASPAKILEARLRVADGFLRQSLGEAAFADEMKMASELARAIAEACDPEGRPLFAAHAALDWPGDPHLVLWHAMTLIREHRGDGHIACLVAEGISGCEAHVLSVAAGNTTSDMQKLARSWSDDDWEAAIRDLHERSLVDADGALTAKGKALKSGIENRTDALAARPLAAVDEDDRQALIGALLDYREMIVGTGGLPFPNPLGLPADPPI